MVTPEAHIITLADLKNIKKLGYSIQGASSINATNYLKVTFPDFNLLKLLLTLENHLTPTSQTDITRQINIDTIRKALVIDYRNNFSGVEDALVFIRKFENKEGSITVFHEYCIIPAPFRNSGIIKKVFLESLKQYINMKADFIYVHAGLGLGGYVWAKYGFGARNKSEMEVILKIAEIQLTRRQYSFVKNIFDVYYSRHEAGEAFPIFNWAALDYMKPILLGSDWHGILNLKDPEQVSKYYRYVSG